MYGRMRSVRQRYLEVCVCFERLRRPICGVFSFQEGSASSPSPTTQTATSDRKKLNCGHPALQGIVHLALNEGLAIPPRHLGYGYNLKFLPGIPWQMLGRALGDRAPPNFKFKTNRPGPQQLWRLLDHRSFKREGTPQPADHNHRRRLGVVI